MKLFRYVCIALVAALACSCNDEDPIDAKKVKEGLSARMSLTVEVPETDEVKITRAINDYESEMNELIIVMYENTSKRQEIINLTGKLKSDSYDGTNGYRRYLLTEDIETKSGNYTAYAIANFNSPYCGLTQDEIMAMSEEELKTALAKNNGKTFALNGTERLPMSQIINDLTIYSKEEVEADASKANRLALKLKRIVAHIEFEFKNDNGVTFNPYEYTVYNLPDRANLLDKENNELSSGVTYFNTPTMSTSGNSFDFFMLENVQTKTLNTVSNYNDRDKWNGYDESTGMKKFTNAPENSTYVVVKGTFSGKSTDYQNVQHTYSGECTYTIHLGDLRNVNDNFNVNRNEFQKYTVTIRGISSITKEVYADVDQQINGGDVPGAEGTLLQDANSFMLDAHYERVRIQIEPEKYESLKSGTHSVVINTPKTQRTYRTVVLEKNGDKYEIKSPSEKEDDIYWITFIKPDNIELVPKYDEEKAGDILDFLTDPDKYCVQSETGKPYYTYAYVDEYFYEDIHPKEFVNTMERSFILDPSNKKESKDETSVLYETTVFEVTQRSIKSSFDMEKIGPGDTPYGIETWNETGGLEWNLKNPSSALSSDQGRQNTLSLLDANNITYKDDVWNYIGYRYMVNDNSKARHRWYDATHYEYYLAGKYNDNGDVTDINEHISDPLTAVLARNRIKTDSNGNIDKSSVQWYLPAICQYLIIWLGQNMLQEDTRLMDVSLLNEYANADAMDKSQHYLSSSENTRRLYWQDQGACWGPIADYTNSYNKIRCVRNIRNDYLDKIWNDGLTKDSPIKFPVERDGRVISMGSISNARTTYMTGGYGAHTERQPENYLYSKFEVATPQNGHFSDKNAYYCCGFSPTTSWGFSDDIVKEMNEKAAQYYQNSDKSDLGQWRVPNQRELMIIAVMDQDNNDIILPKGTSRVHVLTTTWFTGYEKTNRIYPFAFDSGSPDSENKKENDYNLQLPSSLYTTVLLFVRDVK